VAGPHALGAIAAPMAISLLGDRIDVRAVLMSQENVANVIEGLATRS
jgi:hypothetical protein